MSDEASNIVRRFTHVVASLDPLELRYLRVVEIHHRKLYVLERRIRHVGIEPTISAHVAASKQQLLGLIPDQM